MNICLYVSLIVAAIHLGVDGYQDKQRINHYTYSDSAWNLAYVRNVVFERGSLNYAKWKPVGTFSI